MSVNLKEKVRELPNKPGVYLMRDQLGRVIYVGKAQSLRQRVGQYFHPSRRHRHDRKTHALVESVSDFDTYVVNSEAEALLLEGKLIKEYKPRYNAMFKDDKRFLLVKIHMGEPYPRFTFARIRKDDGARYFGPFVHAGAVRRAMLWIRKNYGVLVAGTGRPTEKELKYSTYLVPVPLGEMPREEYLRRIELACDFLDGKNKEALAQLEEQMRTAAQSTHFEKAAELRDVISSLREFGRATRERRFAREVSIQINPQSEIDGLQQVFKLPTSPRHIEGFDISNISGTLTVASSVCFVMGRPNKDHYRHYQIKTVEGSDDFASMTEVVNRRFERICSEGEKLPDLIMVDGGKGQLTAALRALRKLGIRDLSVIGLAKQMEEIFVPHQALPIRLPRNTPALHLIQRLRDEAHRFANSYHQKLRKRRIKESVLDEIPGLGEKRKLALLKHFGSIKRLRRATKEEITRVRGIGLKFATALHEFLSKS